MNLRFYIVAFICTNTFLLFQFTQKVHSSILLRRYKKPQEIWRCSKAHNLMRKPHPTDCHKYLECRTRYYNKFFMKEFSCSGKQVFDEIKGKCNPPDKVNPYSSCATAQNQNSFSQNSFSQNSFSQNSFTQNSAQVEKPQITIVELTDNRQEANTDFAATKNKKGSRALIESESEEVDRVVIVKKYWKWNEHEPLVPSDSKGRNSHQNFSNSTTSDMVRVVTSANSTQLGPYFTPDSKYRVDPSSKAKVFVTHTLNATKSELKTSGIEYSQNGTLLHNTSSSSRNKVVEDGNVTVVAKVLSNAHGRGIFKQRQKANHNQNFEGSSEVLNNDTEHVIVGARTSNNNSLKSDTIKHPVLPSSTNLTIPETNISGNLFPQPQKNYSTARSFSANLNHTNLDQAVVAVLPVIKVNSDDTKHTFQDVNRTRSQTSTQFAQNPQQHQNYTNNSSQNQFGKFNNSQFQKTKEHHPNNSTFLSSHPQENTDALHKFYSKPITANQNQTTKEIVSSTGTSSTNAVLVLVPVTSNGHGNRSTVDTAVTRNDSYTSNTTNNGNISNTTNTVPPKLLNSTSSTATQTALSISINDTDNNSLQSSGRTGGTRYFTNTSTTVTNLTQTRRYTTTIGTTKLLNGGNSDKNDSKLENSSAVNSTGYDGHSRETVSSPERTNTQSIRLKNDEQVKTTNGTKHFVDTSGKENTELVNDTDNNENKNNSEISSTKFNRPTKNGRFISNNTITTTTLIESRNSKKTSTDPNNRTDSNNLNVEHNDSTTNSFDKAPRKNATAEFNQNTTTLEKNGTADPDTAANSSLQKANLDKNYSTEVQIAAASGKTIKKDNNVTEIQTTDSNETPISGNNRTTFTKTLEVDSKIKPNETENYAANFIETGTSEKNNNLSKETNPETNLNITKQFDAKNKESGLKIAADNGDHRKTRNNLVSNTALQAARNLTYETLDTRVTTVVNKDQQTSEIKISETRAAQNVTESGYIAESTTAQNQTSSDSGNQTGIADNLHTSEGTDTINVTENQPTTTATKIEQIVENNSTELVLRNNLNNSSDQSNSTFKERKSMGRFISNMTVTRLTTDIYTSTKTQKTVSVTNMEDKQLKLNSLKDQTGNQNQSSALRTERINQGQNQTDLIDASSSSLSSQESSQTNATNNTNERFGLLSTVDGISQGLILTNATSGTDFKNENQHQTVLLAPKPRREFETLEKNSIVDNPLVNATANGTDINHFKVSWTNTTHENNSKEKDQTMKISDQVSTSRNEYTNSENIQNNGNESRSETMASTKTIHFNNISQTQQLKNFSTRTKTNFTDGLSSKTEKMANNTDKTQPKVFNNSEILSDTWQAKQLKESKKSADKANLSPATNQNSSMLYSVSVNGNSETKQHQTETNSTNGTSKISGAGENSHQVILTNFTNSNQDFDSNFRDTTSPTTIKTSDIKEISNVSCTSTNETKPKGIDLTKASFNNSTAALNGVSDNGNGQLATNGTLKIVMVHENSYTDTGTNPSNSINQNNLLTNEPQHGQSLGHSDSQQRNITVDKTSRGGSYLVESQTRINSSSRRTITLETVQSFSETRTTTSVPAIFNSTELPNAMLTVQPTPPHETLLNKSFLSTVRPDQNAVTSLSTDFYTTNQAKNFSLQQANVGRFIFQNRNKAKQGGQIQTPPLQVEIVEKTTPINVKEDARNKSFESTTESTLKSKPQIYNDTSFSLDSEKNPPKAVNNIQKLESNYTNTNFLNNSKGKILNGENTTSNDQSNRLALSRNATRTTTLTQYSNSSASFTQITKVDNDSTIKPWNIGSKKTTLTFTPQTTEVPKVPGIQTVTEPLFSSKHATEKAEIFQSTRSPTISTKIRPVTEIIPKATFKAETTQSQIKEMFETSTSKYEPVRFTTAVISFNPKDLEQPNKMTKNSSVVITESKIAASQRNRFRTITATNQARMQNKVSTEGPRWLPLVTLSTNLEKHYVSTTVNPLHWKLSTASGNHLIKIKGSQETTKDQVTTTVYNVPNASIQSGNKNLRVSSKPTFETTSAPKSGKELQQLSSSLSNTSPATVAREKVVITTPKFFTFTQKLSQAEKYNLQTTEASNSPQPREYSTKITTRFKTSTDKPKQEEFGTLQRTKMRSQFRTITSNSYLRNSKIIRMEEFLTTAVPQLEAEQKTNARNKPFRFSNTEPTTFKPEPVVKSTKMFPMLTTTTPKTLEVLLPLTTQRTRIVRPTTEFLNTEKLVSIVRPSKMEIKKKETSSSTQFPQAHFHSTEIPHTTVRIETKKQSQIITQENDKTTKSEGLFGFTPTSIPFHNDSRIVAPLSDSQLLPQTQMESPSVTQISSPTNTPSTLRGRKFLEKSSFSKTTVRKTLTSQTELNLLGNASQPKSNTTTSQSEAYRQSPQNVNESTTPPTILTHSTAGYIKSTIQITATESTTSNITISPQIPNNTSPTTTYDSSPTQIYNNITGSTIVLENRVTETENNVAGTMFLNRSSPVEIINNVAGSTVLNSSNTTHITNNIKGRKYIYETNSTRITNNITKSTTIYESSPTEITNNAAGPTTLNDNSSTQITNNEAGSTTVNNSSVTQTTNNATGPTTIKESKSTQITNNVAGPTTLNNAAETVQSTSNAAQNQSANIAGPMQNVAGPETARESSPATMQSKQPEVLAVTPQSSNRVTTQTPILLQPTAKPLPTIPPLIAVFTQATTPTPTSTRKPGTKSPKPTTTTTRSKHQNKPIILPVTRNLGGSDDDNEEEKTTEFYLKRKTKHKKTKKKKKVVDDNDEPQNDPLPLELSRSNSLLHLKVKPSKKDKIDVDVQRDLNLNTGVSLLGL